METNDVSVDEANTINSNEPQDKEFNLNESTENTRGSLEKLSKKRKSMLTTNKHVSKNTKTTESNDQAAEAFGILKNIYENKKVPPDACSSFANHIAMKLRGFDPLTRSHVEFKINQIIYETEISTLQSQCTQYPQSRHYGIVPPSLDVSNFSRNDDTETSTLDSQSSPQHFESLSRNANSNSSTVTNYTDTDSQVRPPFCSPPMPYPQEKEPFNMCDYIIPKTYQNLN